MNKEAVKLYDNRLMKTDENIDNFEKAINALYSENNIENITFFCKAFDDNTDEPPVMFSLIHGIEHYDNVFGKEKATSKFLDSIHFMIPKASDWLETMILRILNDEPSRKVLINQISNKDLNIKSIIERVITSLIERNPEKFEISGNEVLVAIK